MGNPTFLCWHQEGHRQSKTSKPYDTYDLQLIPVHLSRDWSILSFWSSILLNGIFQNKHLSYSVVIPKLSWVKQYNHINETSNIYSAESVLHIPSGDDIMWENQWPMTSTNSNSRSELPNRSVSPIYRIQTRRMPVSELVSRQFSGLEFPWRKRVWTRSDRIRREVHEDGWVEAYSELMNWLPL